MTADWGTVTLWWDGYGHEVRPLTDGLPVHMLEEIPQHAAKENTTPSAYMVQLFISAGLNVRSVNWKGPT